MDLKPLFAIAAVLSFMILGLHWHFTRSAAILQGWADENGYEILEKSYRALFHGARFSCEPRRTRLFTA